MKKTVIKFWAKWCGPCKIYAPIFEKVSNEINISDNNIEFINIDVESDSYDKSKYKLESIPHTIILDENDNIIKQKSGIIRENELKKFILE